jgi:hypothetical protein
MGGRAVEGTGLENRQGRKLLVGSNPTPSAIPLFLTVSDRAALDQQAKEYLTFLSFVVFRSWRRRRNDGAHAQAVSG